MNVQEAREAVIRLRADLEQIVKRDQEQEVQGLALPVLDAVLGNAREHVLPEDPVLSALTDLISPETIEHGESIRALDAYLVAGQLLEALRRADPLPKRWGFGESLE
jgi:hypothetical protein